MTKLILYNGNNEKYFNEIIKDFNILPEYWTTGPLDSLVHAFSSAKRHNSQMLIFVLEDINIEDNFIEDIEIGGLYDFKIKWYQLFKRKNIFKSIEERDKKLKGYKERDLEDFLKKYAPADIYGSDFISYYLNSYLKKLGRNINPI